MRDNEDREEKPLEHRPDGDNERASLQFISLIDNPCLQTCLRSAITLSQPHETTTWPVESSIRGIPELSRFLQHLQRFSPVFPRRRWWPLSNKPRGGGGGGFSDVLPSIASPTDKASISMIAVHDNAVIGTLCPYYCYLHGRFRCRDVCRMVPPPRIYRRLYRTVACMCTVPTYNCPSRQVVKCLGRMESATYSRRSFRFRSVGVSSSWILSSFEGPGVIRSRRTCYHGCPHKNQEYSRTAERGSP